MAEVSFGEWLRRRRRALDLTQEQLARQIHCSTSTLRKIEAEERRPSQQIVKQLAEVFHIAAEERGTFLKFARGKLESALIGGFEVAPWRISDPEGSERKSQPHLATFLFTDIEDSTRLWDIAPEKMKIALQRHHTILHDAISFNGGSVFQVIGDAFCVAFPSPTSAISAAVTAQRGLHQEPWDLPFPIRVRMGIHTGEAEPLLNSSAGGYASSPTLNRVARILTAGHGGQILLSRATKELVKDSLPRDTELCDMAEHYLKNLSQPEHLFQVNIVDLPSDFPPLHTLNVPRHNLPIQLTSFIGREKEIADVIGLLEKSRLVTLTGPGGTGKTRLSIQVASELLDQYPDGVWMVELAPIFDPLLIPRTTAIALGLRDEPQRPVIDMLCDYLREKKMLIILDNCEHLVEACAQLVDILLRACPYLRILASSREILGIGGEISYLVPSLSLPEIGYLPSVESLRQYEAVQLFMDRATSAVPTFALNKENSSSIAQICQRLDGIPLAIELAASKIRALSAQQIAGRLDDRFRLLTSKNRTLLPRHQTLQATIDWSYNLLSREEEILFRRLSVFVGGWTLQAAESVCSDKDPTRENALKTEDILELINQLVNKSLVMTDERNGEVHYLMLETIRQFANDKLQEANEREASQERHLQYFLQLSEAAEPHLLRREQLEWLSRLDVDYENLRAALEWALHKDSPELALRLCASLGTFWTIRCYWIEGSKWLQSALSKPPQYSDQERVARARALYQDARLARNLGDFEHMKSSAERSLALSQEGSDKRDMAIAGLYLGIARNFHGDDNNARALLERSLTQFQELNEPYWESYCFSWLSDILLPPAKLKRTERDLKNLELAHKAGERLNLAEALFDYSYSLFNSNRVEEALEHVQVADSLYRQIGSTRNLTTFFVAEFAWLNGDNQKAISLFTEMRERFRLLGEKSIRSAAIADLGVLALEQGDMKQAQTYLEESVAIAREIGNKSSIANRLGELANVFYFQGDLARCKQLFQESIRQTRDLGRSPNVHVLLLMLNILYIQNAETSARILGAIDNAQKGNVIIIGPLRKRYCARAETHARPTLGEVAFEAAFLEGQKMSLDEAVDLAWKTVEQI